MDESALLSALKSLDASWSALEFWLWVSTAVVVAGVVIEVVVVVRERRHELREFRRGTIHSPEKPSTSKYVLELLGSALVTLGVLGELLVGIAATKVETEMRDATGKLVALANGKAKAAVEHAAVLEKEAEDETLARIEIETRVAWRRLTMTNQKAVASNLKTFSGEMAGVYFINGDTEGGTFASDIASALRMAHWKVAAHFPAPYLFINGPQPPPPTGLMVGSTSDKLSVNASRSLMRELRRLAFDCEKPRPEQGIPQANGGGVFVWVNRRPEGAQGEAKLIEQELSKRQTTSR